MRRGGILMVVLGVAGSPAAALDANRLLSFSVEQQAAGVLSMLGISVVPDSAASALDMRATLGRGSNMDFQASQISGGFTWSEDTPLYLEGSIGYDRYNPDLLMSDGVESGRLRPRWTGVAATGGVGWDFRLGEHLWLRPIVNLSLGQVVSDTQVVAQFIANHLDADELHFLRDGGLTVGGYGGSLALVYNQMWESGTEADAVLRYTNIRLEPVGGDKDIVASASAETLALWTRLRTPTRLEAFERPVRAVYELSGSWLMGDQGEVLNTDWLVQVGVGLEVDVAETSLPWITKGRIVFRYSRGEHLDGYGLGLAVSF